MTFIATENLIERQKIDSSRDYNCIIIDLKRVKVVCVIGLTLCVSSLSFYVSVAGDSLKVGDSVSLDIPILGRIFPIV